MIVLIVEMNNMSKKLNKIKYTLPRLLLETTGIMLGTHLVLELIAVRKPEYWYILPILAILFGLASVINIVIIIYNAYVDYKSHTPPNE